MARVVIRFPEKIVFSHVMDVRIYDVNHGQHLGHDRLISLIHEARNRFFQSLGYEELNIEGTGIVVADLEVVYLGEAFAGEQVKVDVAVANFGGKNMEMFYQVVNAESQKKIAQAKTGIVFFDYDARQPAPVPPAFRAVFD
ncbi:MAG: thioesterase [Gammaproteobacteria bacterium]|nr:MAG: thioesterase [Gammaproteobacteria bacterium]